MICPCDADTPAAAHQSARSVLDRLPRSAPSGDFRRALLTPPSPPPGGTPVENALTAWRADIDADPSVADLAVMMVEWLAYLADILTFLQRAHRQRGLPAHGDSCQKAPGGWSSVLGYRPRPAMGATGTLAALITLVKARRCRRACSSRASPAPGQAPQTFELSTATTIGAPDVLQAVRQPVADRDPVLHHLFRQPVRFALHPSWPPASSSQSKGTARRRYGPPPIVITYQILSTGQCHDREFRRAAGARPRATTRLRRHSSRSTPGRRCKPSRGGKQTALSFTAVGGSASSVTGADRPSAARRPEHRAMEPSTAPRCQSAAPWWSNWPAWRDRSAPDDWVVFTAPGVDAATGADRQRRTCSATQARDRGASATKVSTGGYDAQGSPLPTPIPVLHTALTLAHRAASGCGTTPSYGQRRRRLGVVRLDRGRHLARPAAAALGRHVAQRSTRCSPGVSPRRQCADHPAGLPTPPASCAVASAGDGRHHGRLADHYPVAARPRRCNRRSQAFYNLLPVTRGKTIANEILGSGDATVAGQSFTAAAIAGHLSRQGRRLRQHHRADRERRALDRGDELLRPGRRTRRCSSRARTRRATPMSISAMA